MTTDTFWIFAFCLPMVAVLTESLLLEHKTYVTNAPSQNAFVFKKWTYRGSSFFVTVTKGNITLLSAFFDGVSSKESENRLLIQYNNITKDVSLVLNNVTRGDEGLYQISTSINETVAEGSEIKDNKFNVQLHVVETSEIKQGYAEENILVTEFVDESIFFPRLYHNDQLIAVLRDSGCDVSTNSPFHGRIRCSKDTENNTTRIEINNVSENDTGLYAVITEGSLTKRCFLNITGTYINSANTMIIVTPPDRFDGINSDQPRNITLSTTARNITLSTNVLSGTVVNLASTLCVPIYVIPVMIGAVGLMSLIGFLLWSQRKKIHITKGEQHNPQDDCDPGFYLTPISLEPPLTISTCQERKTGLKNIAQNTNIDPCTASIDMAQMISMDGYEVVDISNDEPAIAMELEEIIHDSTENCITPYNDTSGYLTVIARRETTV